MNILITSAGRRVSLIKAFKKALINNNLNNKVFTTDLNPKNSPAAHFSDKSFKVGKFNELNYNSDLLKICLENNVKIIIPTLDTELNDLSFNYEMFSKEGIVIVISSNDLIKNFSDKISTSNFFKKIKVNTPKIYKSDDIKFPVFVKPISGSNSVGVYRASKISELKQSDLNSEIMMFSEYIDHNVFDEYTVDMYYDKKSNLICSVPRIRLKVVGGESNQGLTKKNEVLDFVKKKFKYLDGARGCITLQLFSRSNDPSEILCIEVNPRFGGGYPFSYNAGADFPDLIIKEYILNQKLNYFETWKDNCLNLRYEEEVIINEK